MATDATSQYERFDDVPRWVLAGGPIVVLAAVLGLLLLTSPFGDASAMAEASLADVLWTLTVVGVFVGIVPVVIGMLWFPFISKLDPARLHAVLALSAGVLAFVGVEMLSETIAYASEAANPTIAAGAAVIGFALTFGGMVFASKWSHARIQRGTGNRGLAVAYLVAVGLGLHSVGEGIAIGSAFMLGDVPLVMLLVFGFLVHNVTEGPTVVAAAARDRDRPPLWHFAVLGLVAGGPLIVGGWIGAAMFSPLLAAALLAVGIGAIAQVIWEVVDLVRFDAERIATRGNTVGFLVGFALMFLLEEQFLALLGI